MRNAPNWANRQIDCAREIHAVSAVISARRESVVATFLTLRLLSLGTPNDVRFAEGMAQAKCVGALRQSARCKPTANERRHFTTGSRTAETDVLAAVYLVLLSIFVVKVSFNSYFLTAPL